MALCKVPANDMEAFKSSLMGLFEKKRVINLYNYLDKVEPEKPDTWNMDKKKPTDLKV